MLFKFTVLAIAFMNLLLLLRMTLFISKLVTQMRDNETTPVQKAIHHLTTRLKVPVFLTMKNRPTWEARASGKIGIGSSEIDALIDLSEKFETSGEVEAN